MPSIFPSEPGAVVNMTLVASSKRWGWRVPAPLWGCLRSTPAADQQMQLLRTGLRSALKTRSWEFALNADDLSAFSYLQQGPRLVLVHSPGSGLCLAVCLVARGVCGQSFTLPFPEAPHADAGEGNSSFWRGFGGDGCLAS